MKIKQKEQLNLPQLIEWAWDNPEQSQYKMFEKIGATMRDYVSFNNEENGVRLNGTVKPTDLFTVEVEEEITEDTVHTMLIATCKRPTLRKIFSHRDNTSIRQYKELEDNDVDSIYMLNDDSTMTLIWRDGKLVD